MTPTLPRLRLLRLPACLVLLVACLGVATASRAAVELVETAAGHELRVDGEPYVVRGVGGSASMELLVKAGGNTVRTWGVGPNTQAYLDQAHRHGIKVVLGIWLGHERHGFDYLDPQQVQQQFDQARDAVQRFKDHPALLMWSVGNEMETGLAGQALDNMWDAVNDIGEMIQQLDPDHPTMCITADLNNNAVAAIRDRCPGIDIHGVNTYGGAPNLPQRYAQAGGTKPYMLTEFGPLGIWEFSPNDFGAHVEPTSTEKTRFYRESHEAVMADTGKCLGTFAFLWGHKQEVTYTWFGMILPDGSKLAAVDTMSQLWTGEPMDNLCPAIETFELATDRVQPGGQVTASLKTSDPENDTLAVAWTVLAEGAEFKIGGDAEEAPDEFADAVVESAVDSATVNAPQQAGIYRLFVTVRDGHGGAAVANLPFLVTATPDKQDVPAADNKPALPFTVYADDIAGPDAPYHPSGYMGTADAIHMNPQSRTNPHTGDTCLEVRYTQGDGWGGVVWQHPAEDWGDQPGGYDLRAAKSLTFWARGENGGETVKFGYGLLKSDATHRDSAGDEIEVTLTDQWKQYTFGLTGKELQRIKTGFYWVLAAEGQPVTFYLDDITYTSDAAE